MVLRDALPRTVAGAFLAAGIAAQPADRAAINDELWEAARAGDTARVASALDRGADVNARTRYAVTALSFAADKGHLEVARLLLDRGADVNAQDSFYGLRPINMALGNRHFALARLLLERGSKGAGAALTAGIQRKDMDLVKAALAGTDIESRSLGAAVALAEKSGDPAIVALVKDAAARMPAPPAPTVTVDPETLRAYAGRYSNEGAGLTLTVRVSGGQLRVEAPGQPVLTLRPTAAASFEAVEVPGVALSFGGRGGLVENLTVTQGSATLVLPRVTGDAPAGTPPAAGDRPSPPAESKPPAPSPADPAPRAEPRPWPSFRGPDASGVADGQGAVIEWDVTSGRHIKWKTPVPGIANSSPVVWGDRVFVTSASSDSDKTFRTGLYGDVAPVEDLSEHTWTLYALDRDSGRIVWQREVFKGAPRVKRHPKSSQASSTPATDGRHVVAVFGSIGLAVCYDVEGKLLWTRNIGVVDNGWFFDPSYQWGHSSSPVIYRNTAIVQVDQQQGSYIAAFDLASGRDVWRTGRDEISTWGTPGLYRGPNGDELITNGTRVRAYDPASGRLLWTLGPNSEITVATPVAGADLVYVTGGYPPVRPVYAIRPGRTGDLTLAKGQSASDAIAWSNDREGTYIPTPILYDGLLYTCNNNGILTVYRAKTGEQVYRARLGGTGGSFSASPVAADGRLYFASEDGDVFVIRAGERYDELAKNQMKEVIMATPAISGGLIILRTISHVYGIGR
jgi:outer membrane protein assembly factor BamB